MTHSEEWRQAGRRIDELDRAAMIAFLEHRCEDARELLQKLELLLNAYPHVGHEIAMVDQYHRLYYKCRERWPNALAQCEKYCWRAIDLHIADRRGELPSREDQNKLFGAIIYDPTKSPYYDLALEPPPAPVFYTCDAFKRLTILYENTGNLPRAVQIARMAVDWEIYPVNENRRRLERLERKLWNLAKKPNP